MNAVVSNEKGPYSDTDQGPQIWFPISRHNQMTETVPQHLVSSDSYQHQIGANSTLDRNSEQAKIAGRSNGLTVDLRGH